MAKSTYDTLGIYIPRVVDKKELNDLLGDVAASLGYIATGGPNKGEGSVGALLVALAYRDAVVFRMGDYYELVQVTAWLRRQIEMIRAMSPAERRKLGRVEDWIRQQIDAIQAQDPNDIRDDTTLEDFLLGLHEQMEMAFQRRHAKDDIS